MTMRIDHDNECLVLIQSETVYTNAFTKSTAICHYCFGFNTGLKTWTDLTKLSIWSGESGGPYEAHRVPANWAFVARDPYG